MKLPKPDEFPAMIEVLLVLRNADGKGFIPLPSIALHYLAAGNIPTPPPDRAAQKRHLKWSGRLVTAVEKLVDVGVLYRSYRFRDREFNSLTEAIRDIKPDTNNEDPLTELIPGFYFTARGTEMVSGKKKTLTDEAIRQIILNTESLYQWAREEGKGGDNEMYANLPNFIKKNRRELVRRIQGE